jgi:hypothetical protein
MKAFTVYPWWAWAFVALGKPTENRGWAPPLAAGAWVAIHAGARRLAGGADLDALVDDAARAGWEVSARGNGEVAFRRGTTAAPCTFDERTYVDARAVRGAVVAVAQFWGADRRDEGRGPWAQPGCWHWQFGAAIPLPRPVSVRGQQGLWMLPDPVIRAIAPQVPAAVLYRPVTTNVTTNTRGPCTVPLR